MINIIITFFIFYFLGTLVLGTLEFIKKNKENKKFIESIDKFIDGQAKADEALLNVLRISQKDINDSLARINEHYFPSNIGNSIPLASFPHAEIEKKEVYIFPENIEEKPLKDFTFYLEYCKNTFSKDKNEKEVIGRIINRINKKYGISTNKNN